MINTIHKEKLEYLASDRIQVPHCFTTRRGGVSEGYLDSLNIGTNRGDSIENVMENFRILGNALGFELEDVVRTCQTHTDIVRKVGAADRGTGLLKPAFPPCDALITNEPGVCLVISTADCTPILLYDPVTGAVGAAHAGWRGTAADIAGKTVKAMAQAYGCKPENLRCAIGPNIGQCCFETDADVPDALRDAFGSAAEAWTRQQENKYYVDLKAANAYALRRAGVAEVDISIDCTACQPQRFWSHRVTRGVRGSQGALIVCGRENG